MRQITQWFNSLPKREQYALLIAAAAVALFLVYGVLFRGVVDYRDDYRRRVDTAQSSLASMKDTVDTIKGLKGSSSEKTAAVGKSLAQLSEMAAGRASIRINRFAPVGDNEAQLWFERVEFAGLLDCIARLELDYGIVIDSIAINSANSPGLVNARLRISR